MQLRLTRMSSVLQVCGPKAKYWIHLDWHDGGRWKVRRYQSYYHLLETKMNVGIKFQTLLHILTCLVTNPMFVSLPCSVGLRCCLPGLLYIFTHDMDRFFSSFSFFLLYRFPLKSNVEKMTPVLPNLRWISTSCMYTWQIQHSNCNINILWPNVRGTLSVLGAQHYWWQKVTTSTCLYHCPIMAMTRTTPVFQCTILRASLSLGWLLTWVKNQTSI